MTILFKLGGSLLSLSGVADRLRAVVDQRPGEQCLVMVGGGATTDVVRDWSHTHQLTEEVAHWLAISSLELNRELVHALLSWKTVGGRTDAKIHWEQDAAPLLLNFRQFVLAEEPTTKLSFPHHWDVTSDSLAAWTSFSWPVDELILLKSVSLPTAISVQSAADSGFVDNFFPKMASSVGKISWCNLRSPHPTIQPWIRAT